MDTSLHIHRLTKNFGPTRALKGINLEVRSGEFVILLGPSGCGKTTILRSIAGITEPTSGEIWLADRRIDAIAPEKRNFGMVFQTYALFPHISVEKNIAFGLEMRHVPKREINRRVAVALETVGLLPQARRLPKQLSGGQQQRVALARAIVIEPDVLLFDEPLSNLDAKLRDMLREELRSLQQKLAITSIYVTHDQSEAMALADQIVVMKEGEIVEYGSPVHLYRRPRYRFTAEFLGMTNVIEAEISGGQCRLPWGEARPLENPNEPDAQGVAIRPEDIAITPVANSAHGVVKRFMFMGASTHYWVAVAGMTLRIISTGGQSDILATGQQVRLSLPPALHQLKAFGSQGAQA